MNPTSKKVPHGKLEKGKSCGTMSDRAKTPPPVIQEAMLEILRREIAKPGAQKQLVVKGICTPGTLTKWLAGTLSMSLRHVEKILNKYGDGMNAQTLVVVVETFRDRPLVLKNLLKIYQSGEKSSIGAIEQMIEVLSAKI